MSEEESDVLEPSYCDFDAYLPWACRQLEIYTTINITRIQQNVYIGIKKKRTIVKSSIKTNTYINLLQKIHLDNNLGTNTEICDMVRITTVYDHTDNLVQLKFNNNKKIPITILKVIRLIIKFQNCLTNVTINKGLDKAGVHELSKWLALTNITDICLDNSVINDGNYDSLLEKDCLKNLSLCRCKIDDDVLKKITLKMAYLLPASKTLTSLQLSSNRITDKGAKYVSEMLRTNRQLGYLNLSDNAITDDGFIAILDILQEFPIRSDEMIATKSEYVRYIREKTNLIAQLMKEIQNGTFEETSLKKNTNRASVITNASSRKNKVTKLSIDGRKSEPCQEISWQDKVKTIAESKTGKFVHPYCPENIHHKDDQEYCYGNNSLAYINISYNDISHLSVIKLWNVLSKQKLFDRTPRGLVNVSIDGNCLPANSMEINKICEILNENLAQSSAKQTMKKSRMVKSEPCVLAE